MAYVQMGGNDTSSLLKKSKIVHKQNININKNDIPHLNSENILETISPSVYQNGDEKKICFLIGLACSSLMVVILK